uniref:GST N-terminal domain-containing protein n=1 Tax=Gongylonema pulchrum TaxID=637853 RepID=A0A183EIP3_9BILA
LGSQSILEPGFRLGESDTLLRYVNQYRVNEYAKNPTQRTREKDKRKYMCGRFSLMDEKGFEWSQAKGRSIAGSPDQVGAVIQDTLESFAQKIPSVLMHRLWRRDGLDNFKKGLNAPPSVELLRDLLLRFECAIRRPVFHNVWWSSLGHTRLMRITVEDRERRQYYEAKKKKLERDLLSADADDEEVIWVKYHKVGAVIKRTLWRQNDENYRVNGRGALGGWLWVSKTFRRRFIPKAQRPTIGGKLEPTTLANRKAIRLEGVLKRLNEWRNTEFDREERLVHFHQIMQLGRTTSSVVHAHPQSPECKKENGSDEKVLGIDKPFPLPVPLDYRVRRTGEQSLLVLPQKALKRLARQGGVNSGYFAPGFHRMAKSNTQVWNYPCPRPLFDNCWRFASLLQAVSILVFIVKAFIEILP